MRYMIRNYQMNKSVPFTLFIREKYLKVNKIKKFIDEEETGYKLFCCKEVTML